MSTKNCWYCNKELTDPITTYRRKHIRAKMRTDISVHTSCYKALNKARKRYRPRVSGSVSQ